ncbi:MAG: glycosyltransferase family 2 protein [Oligoflexia bacterium]|nr:glycosyltransferase family 2 protein [Oligoflexia bacterium]
MQNSISIGPSGRSGQQTNPRVSVLLPVYNAAAYLAEAIQSILDQTFTDFELILINDGSTDGSVEIIHSFKDPRIRLIDLPKNGGLIAALNRGIAESKGEYIARMDADDISLPHRFARQVEFLDRFPKVSVCGTHFEVFFGSNPFVMKHPADPQDVRDELLFTGCVLGHPTVMIRKADLVALGARYEERFKNAEDYGLWATLSSQTQLANIPEVLLKYREHQQQVSRVHSASQEMATREIKVLLLLNLLPIDLRTDGHRALLLEALASNTQLPNTQIEDTRLREFAQLLMQLYKANRQKSAFYTESRLRRFLLQLWHHQFTREQPKSWKRWGLYYTFPLVFDGGPKDARRHLGLLKRRLGIQFLK